jgi:hypothetical protein
MTVMSVETKWLGLATVKAAHFMLKQSSLHRAPMTLTLGGQRK